MAVVDKGGGVVEMVPRDEDGEVMETEEGSEVAVVKTVSAEDKRKFRDGFFKHSSFVSCHVSAK